ncbi:MAG: methylmalonyl Co-A mutase-associated GTPase MeaB [Candidatus Hydrothermia bacterium]|jgi:LAO/AO transport system kinase|nr:methylmalonyl Co-A mutase-associated GTPase MeaB [Candidatus Hydrothermia bacterium]
MNTRELIERFKNKDRLALSKIITKVENNMDIEIIFSEIYKFTGKAHRIGITGPPGAGKSTLLNKIAIYFKRQNYNPSIIAVDPSSPFSGGALLGDRFRMMEALNEGIYIRSMASRGSLGGIAKTTIFVADVMDAFGFDPIFIETVGVGQIELDIIKASDTVVVVLVPESGDSIQAMKAGLMEIGDIFVINKSDREGADKLYMDIKSVLDMGFNTKDKNWKVPIIKVSALKDIGIKELFEAIINHKNYIKESEKIIQMRKKRYYEEIEELIKEELWQEFKKKNQLEKLVEEGFKNKKSPYELIKEII